MDSDQKFKVIRTSVVVLAVLFAIFLTKELLNPFLLSFVLAYVFYPAYRWLLNRTHRTSVSSFFTMFLILSIALGPAFGFIGALVQELSNLVKQGGSGYLQYQASLLLEAFTGFVKDYLPAQFADRLVALGDIWATVIATISPIIQELALNFASNVPLYFTEALVAAFFTYYFLIDGKGMIDRAVELMPDREITAHFLKELDAIYASLFRLFFATAAIIGVLGAVGYFVLGVPYPVLLGILTGVTALVPMVGPFVIFGPIAVYFITLQDFTRAFATLFFGVVFLAVLPGNYILPKLASRGASIHPLITLLAFTAPLLVVGASGMIIGPAVYGFVLASFRTWIYFKEMKARDDISVAPVRP